MAKENNISILISAVDEATKVFKNIGGSITDFAKKNEKTFKSMRNIGAVAFWSITAQATMAIAAFKWSETQMVRVDQILKNIDYKWLAVDMEQAWEKAREFGTKLQSLSWIGDEMAAESFSKLFQITKDVTQAQNLATLAADLSIAKNMDMDSATKLVSMTLAGNTRALKEYGIQLDENATPLQNLAELQKRVGWQAEAYGKTLEWQGVILNQTFWDMQEAIWGALAPAMSKLLWAIQPIISSIVDWASKNPDLVAKILLVAGAVAWLVTVLGTLGLAIPAIIGGITALGTALAFLVANPIGIAIVAIAWLVTAWWALYNNWEQVKTNIILVWEQIWRDISTIITAISTRISLWISNTKLVFSQLWADIKAIIDWVKSWIVESVAGIFNDVSSTVQSIFWSVVNYINSKVETILWALKRARDALKEIATLGYASTPTYNGTRATGGYISWNTPYLVGERWPEIIVPTWSGRVVPNNQLGGWQSINITFQNVNVSNGIELDALAEKIKSVIYNEHRYARLWM